MTRHPATTSDTRALATVMHTAFFLLLGASVARFLLRHPGEPRTPWVISLGIALALLYVLGPAVGVTQATRATEATDRHAPAPTLRRRLWLGLVVVTWVVLVVLAPSFAWCAVPLFFTALRTLPRAPPSPWSPYSPSSSSPPR